MMGSLSLFSKQKQFCPICGMEFEAELSWNKPRLCSPKCKKEFEWRATLSIRGDEYTPRMDDDPR